MSVSAVFIRTDLHLGPVTIRVRIHDQGSCTGDHWRSARGAAERTFARAAAGDGGDRRAGGADVNTKGVVDGARSTRGRANHVLDQRDALGRVEHDIRVGQTGLEGVGVSLADHEAGDGDRVATVATGERVSRSNEADDTGHATGVADVLDLEREVTGATIGQNDRPVMSPVIRRTTVLVVTIGVAVLQRAFDQTGLRQRNRPRLEDSGVGAGDRFWRSHFHQRLNSRRNVASGPRTATSATKQAYPGCRGCRSRCRRR